MAGETLAHRIEGEADPDGAPGLIAGAIRAEALLGGILVADTGLVALPEEPVALREAVLFTRWRSDCLGCLISSRSRLRIYWRLRPIRTPGVPPAPVIALPSPPTTREERPGPPSPPRPEPDLKTKIREDWETTKRDARNAGNEIKDAFRRFRDWISP